MTNIMDFEELFTDTILLRAVDYENEDDIEILDYSPEIIRARVFGTYPYSVLIKFDDGEIDHMACNCLYDLDYCKHLAAVLFFVRDREDDDPIIQQDKTPDLEHLLQQKTKAELIAGIKELLDWDPEVSPRLRFILSQNQEDEATPEYYEGFVEKYLDKYTEEQFGFLDPDSYYDISYFFNEHLSRLSSSYQHKALILLSTEIIRQVNAHLPHADHSDGILIGLVEEAFNRLKPMVKELENPEARELLWNRLNELLDDSNIFYWDCGYYCWDLLSRMVEDRDQYEELCEILEKSYRTIKGRTTGKYKQEEMIRCKLLALEQFADAVEVHDFKLECREIRSVRNGLIDGCIRDKQFEQALDLVEEGIVLAEAMDDAHDLEHWEEYRLRIALERGRKEDILRWAEYNLLHHSFDMNNFRLTKKYTPPEEWPAKREELITKLGEKNRYFKPNYLPDIYAEEGLHERLLERLDQKRTTLRTLDEYAPYLVREHLDEVVDLYLPRIYNFVARNMGRNNYQIAAEYLRQLHDWGASKQARKLTQRLREEFSNRPAMLDEFEEL